MSLLGVWGRGERPADGHYLFEPNAITFSNLMPFAFSKPNDSAFTLPFSGPGVDYLFKPDAIHYLSKPNRG